MAFGVDRKSPPGVKTRVNLPRPLDREATTNHELLHALIARKLQAGRLPRDRPPRIFGAPGTGGTCDACEEVLSAAQLVMTLLLQQDGTVGFLHADCFVVWDCERRVLRPLSPDGDGGAV